MPGGQISASAAIDFRAQNATFCATAQRPLADPQPTQNEGGSGCLGHAFVTVAPFAHY